MFVFNLYKNRINTINKCGSVRLYPEAGPVPEESAVPFPTVDILSYLKKSIVS
jgi:hypothetical protein